MNPRHLQVLCEHHSYYNDPEAKKKKPEPGTPLELKLLSEMRMST